MSDEFKMSTGQAHELAMAFGRGGWTNAEVKTLCYVQNLARVLQFIRGNAEIKRVFLLSFVGRAILPATGEFVVRDHFKVDTSDTAAVKVSYLGDNFKRWFLSKVEAAKPEMSIHHWFLTKASGASAIIAELTGEICAATTMAEVWSLMERQKNGECGALHMDNAFFVRDINGVLRMVRMGWRDNGWNVNAYSVEGDEVWSAGDLKVFSRVGYAAPSATL